jgi:hypothetical protein
MSFLHVLEMCRPRVDVDDVVVLADTLDRHLVVILAVVTPEPD